MGNKRRYHSPESRAMSKKQKKPLSCWTNLPSELLESIAAKLPFLEIPRFKLVCRSWNTAAQAFSLAPVLMIPSSADQEEENLEDNKAAFPMKKNLFRLLEDGRCVGSSHGWLIVLDKDVNPFLLNPFSGAEIQLPKKENFPHINTIQKIHGKFNVRYTKGTCQCVYLKDFQQSLIVKAILSANPSDNKNFKVIVIYGYHSRLAFCNQRDERWATLGNSEYYEDVVCHDNMLYALRRGLNVEVWNLAEPLHFPKIIFANNSPISASLEIIPRCSTQWYLVVQSIEDIFFIVRYIGDFVNQNGEVLSEEDLLPEDDSHPLVCPYRTINFKVYKLDLLEDMLVEVKSLDDQMLYLGGNQSMSISAKDYEGLQENSIYFTDDYWERVDEDYLYGGHDIGIFNLENQSVELICDVEKFEPTPFWVFPGCR